MTTNNAIPWYNKLSLIHDLLSFNDWPYREARQHAIDALDLQPGDVVIDMFCGTGINFGPILNGIGKDGHLLGIDGSAGMLTQARKRIQKAGWNQSQMTLIEQDVFTLVPQFFDDLVSFERPPKVLITLALGVFANYEDVFTTIFAAMPVGTLFVILEGYCEKGARGAWLLNYIGHSDCRRLVWEPVKALTDEYHETWYPTKFKYIKGSLIVASGVKGK